MHLKNKPCVSDGGVRYIYIYIYMVKTTFGD